MPNVILLINIAHNDIYQLFYVKSSFETIDDLVKPKFIETDGN